MPPNDAPNLSRFVHRLRRRMTLLRAAEGAGLGLLAASAVAAGLLPIMWWRGDDGVALAVSLGGLGVAVGTIWKLRDRPRPLDAAAEADRQLRLSDLLATAWTIDGRGDPAAAAWVRRQADARCAVLTPASLVLAKLSGRAWGGIGLAAVAVAVLTMFTVTTPRSVARRSEAAANSADVAAADGLAASRASASRPRPTTERPDTGRGQTASAIDSGRSTRTAAVGASAGTNQSPTAGDGAGGGVAATPAGDARLPDAAASGGRRSTDEAGNVAGGTGAAATVAMTNDAATAGTVTGGRAAEGRPDMTGDGSAAEPAPRVPVDHAAVPDRYRDVVGEYFSRQ